MTYTFSTALKDLNSDRVGAIDHSNCLICTESLLKNSLRSVVRILKKEFGEDLAFEISVFYNQENPDILYYYDSSGKTKPSSFNERKLNPKYYIEKEYAVVEFMKRPCNEVLMFDDLRKHDYSFTNNQRTRIKSQAMFYLSHEGPYVLVITSDQKKTFDYNDKRCLQIVEALGNYIKADILLKKTMDNCDKTYSNN